MKIVNKTPHAIDVYCEDGKMAHFPSAGAARLVERQKVVDAVEVGDCRIPIFHKTFSPDVSIPPKQEGVIYIVSLAYAQAYPDRLDFVTPNDLVRDDHGRVIGCESFARVK